MGAHFCQVQAAGLRIGTGRGLLVESSKEGGIGWGVRHIFQRAIDGHQPQAKGEGAWRLWGGQGSTDLAEEPAQHAQPQGLPPVAQGSLGRWRLTVVRTHPAPSA